MLPFLVNGNGRPRRATSYGELARLTGYHPDTVRSHLQRMKGEGRWLVVNCPPGKGLYIRPTIPPEVLERLALQDELRHGHWDEL